jgi:archaemetzincin
VAVAVAATLAVAVWVATALRGSSSSQARPAPPRVDPARGAALRAEPLEPRFAALIPLQRPLPAPEPGDWLSEHAEPGQSYARYVAASPVRALPTRRTVYLQPLGEFSAAQLRLMERTAEYLGQFFQLPVTTLPALPASAVPASARRKEQLLTTFILNTLLMPRRPDDALAVLALTAADLYPAPDWAFVFGEASTTERVGVWSLARNGPPESTLALQRTLKTAAHELGHMLSLPHCIAWSCVMNGSNSLEEADHQSPALCPVCLQKLTWNVGLDPAARFEALAAFEADAGLSEELASTQQQRAALEAGAR